MARRSAVAAILAVAAAALLRSRVFLVRVHGRSMTPTYRPGERLVAVRGTGRLRRGDVVVFRPPRSAWPLLAPAERGRPALKRLAALPGDALPSGTGRVPAGHAFLVGERPRTLDSRTYGPVPVNRVLGRLVRPRPAPPRGGG